VDEADHWLYECRGVNGVADKLRSRHREIVQKHLGMDILDEEIRWWLTPLAAGHVHPGCWKYCSFLAHGALQWAVPRAKVLYLLVRMAKFGCDMWGARCADVYAHTGRDAERRDAILGPRRARPASEAPETAQDAAAARRAEILIAAATDAESPLDQWRAGDTPEHAEGCGVCTRKMDSALHCSLCEVRHCCGTEDVCRRCESLEEEQNLQVRGAVELLDPIASWEETEVVHPG
jgi:hypothetical protein